MANESKLNILIITQKVDINDDLLGFFHGWLKKLAGRVGKISVIALSVGDYDLPANIRVFSLGKERYWSSPKIVRRLIAVWRFYKYTWQLRKDYDCVFVHMNVEYVLLAGWLWRLLNKKLVLWYAHLRVDYWQAKLAFFWPQLIVTSTANACKIKSRKLRIIGQGIDVDLFWPKEDLRVRNEEKDKFHILYLGRISKVKNVDTLVRAFGRLLKKNNNFILSIVGEPTPADKDYNKLVHDLVSELRIADSIKFYGKTPNFLTVDFYNQADLYVNLTPTGSFDKTSLEAMACETPTLTCNRAFEEYLDKDLQEKMIFRENDEDDLSVKIKEFFSLSSVERKQTGQRQRKIVKKYHSLDNLINNLINVFQEISR